MGDRSGLREKRRRILRVDAHLDRVPALLHRSECKRLARGDPQLELDDVEAGNGLRDGVLDLDAPVQLQEVDVAAVEEKLRRSRVAIADRGGKPGCGVAEASLRSGCERRRGGLLDHLLVAALYRAVAQTQHVHGGTVGQQLHLDVPRSLDPPFAEHRVVAEGRLCLAPGGRERRLQVGRVAHDPHAAPAAAGRRLDEQRVADLVRAALGQSGNPGCGCDPLRLELVAAQAQRRGMGADPREPCIRDRLGERRVLCQEAVARMDGVGSRLARGAQVLGRIEVGRDLDSGVRGARVQRTAVVCGRDRDRSDAERPARAKHA